jgi:hypothetical protein
MNRRRFLSFLSAAPIGLPLAAQAMAAQAHPFIGGFTASEFVGIDGGSMMSDFVMPEPIKSFAIELDIKRTPQFEEMMARLDLSRALSVAEQVDDDLALLTGDDLDSSVTEDTSRSHASRCDSENLSVSSKAATT